MLVKAFALDTAVWSTVKISPTSMDTNQVWWKFYAKFARDDTKRPAPVSYLTLTHCTHLEGSWLCVREPCLAASPRNPPSWHSPTLSSSCCTHLLGAHSGQLANHWVVCGKNHPAVGIDKMNVAPRTEALNMWRINRSAVAKTMLSTVYETKT